VSANAPVPNGHLVLQALVDEAFASGRKHVDLPSGVFMMHAPLYLRTGVSVRGNNTVLKKAPAVRSNIVDHLGYGLHEFRVVDPHLFEIGMAVHLLDNNSGGFYTTVAKITDRIGDAFIIDTPLRHDYTPSAEAFAINAHSLIEGGWITDATVENITLDGNVAQVPFRINGCRAGAVFLIGCDRVSLRNLHVKDFNGDAVSFQQCTSIRVEKCDIHHNIGAGLHPGSGSVKYWCVDNHIHHNAADGFFYCLRTTHSLVTGNHIHDNQGVGISIGERDTDHIIENNTVESNRKAAIFFRTDTHSGGNRVIIKNNTLGKNPEHPGIVVQRHITDVWIEANRFVEVATAVEVKSGQGRIACIDNTVDGRPLTEKNIQGAAMTERVQALAQSWPRVGPDAVEKDHVKHLGPNVTGF
jgi:parallel beta-helix repeat protein